MQDRILRPYAKNVKRKTSWSIKLSVSSAMETVHNPHDKLFQEIYSRKEEAQSVLEHSLPQDVVSHLMNIEHRTRPTRFDVERSMFDVRLFQGPECPGRSDRFPLSLRLKAQAIDMCIRIYEILY